MSFIGKKQNVISASQARARLSEVLSAAAGGRSVLIRRRGGPDTVVIGADEYRRLRDPVISAAERVAKAAKRAGLHRLKMSEIDAEIAADRRERQGRRRGPRRS